MRSPFLRRQFPVPRDTVGNVNAALDRFRDRGLQVDRAILGCLLLCARAVALVRQSGNSAPTASGIDSTAVVLIMSACPR
jgi:hypothetical protein